MDSGGFGVFDLVDGGKGSCFLLGGVDRFEFGIMKDEDRFGRVSFRFLGGGGGGVGERGDLFLRS